MAIVVDLNNDDSVEALWPGLRLRVLSWNIEGISEKNREERTLVVVETINRLCPHVVFLQEVVPQTLRMIRKKLGSAYSVHISPNVKAGYIPAILVSKKTKKIVINGEVGIFDFPGSSMGRHMLLLCINVCGVPMALYTSHLESMRDFSIERKKQLKTCFNFIDEQSRCNGRACIFGGDLNVKEYEISDVGLPQSTVDVWQTCGSVKRHEYTWDISANDNLDWPFDNEPRLRFDRLYLTSKDGYVKAKSFELVGKERIPSCNRFPSDHWGMFAVFSVSEKKTEYIFY